MEPLYASFIGCVKHFADRLRKTVIILQKMLQTLRQNNGFRIRQDWLELAHGKTASARKFSTGSATEQTRTSAALYRIAAQRRFHPHGLCGIGVAKVFFKEPRTSNANHAQSSHGRTRCVRSLSARCRGYQGRASVELCKGEPASAGVHNGGELNDRART